jgi:hypothetical protein
VAVGDPATILPPDQHEAIWAIQSPLDFPLTVYGVDRPDANMITITRRLAESLGSHREDRQRLIGSVMRDKHRRFEFVFRQHPSAQHEGDVE